jgi:hypothetical protein
MQSNTLQITTIQLLIDVYKATYGLTVGTEFEPRLFDELFWSCFFYFLQFLGKYTDGAFSF